MHLVPHGRRSILVRTGMLLGLLGLLLTGLPAGAATHDDDEGVALRMAGADRVATSVTLSAAREAADAVVIARADAYPDALSGAPLAAALDAPVLLTGRDALDVRVADEVRRLGATTAYLLGGDAALSDAVRQGLVTAGATAAERIAGADRYETAARVAAAVVALTGADRAYVVEGAHADEARGWPDAVAVSGLAALEGTPVLLATRSTLPEPTTEALTALALTRATVVGGTAAISAQVADAIAGTGAQVDRVSGPTRYATSAALADRAVAAGADPARLWVATGRNWPDALAAGPAVAADGGVLLLVDGHGLDGSPAAREWLAAAALDRVVVVGGAGAVRVATVAAIERLAAEGRGEVTVSVFFHRDAGEPGDVVPLPRTVRPPGVLRGAMTALLAGPTEEERLAGHWSWFSEETEGMLRAVRIDDGVAHIDFEDFSDVIPNASTSAGARALLAELDATATQFPSVVDARYAFAGDEGAFYRWLQLVPPR